MLVGRGHNSCGNAIEGSKSCKSIRFFSVMQSQQDRSALVDKLIMRMIILRSILSHGLLRCNWHASCRQQVQLMHRRLLVMLLTCLSKLAA